MSKVKIPRPEDPLFSLKESLFKSDSRTWHLVPLRCPQPHAQVLAVVHPNLPDNIKLILPGDLPGASLITLWDAKVPLMAWDHVEYKGETIGFLAGPHPGDLRAFAERVQIITRKKLLVSGEETSLLEERIFTRGDMPSMENLTVVEGTYSTSSQDPQNHSPLEILIRPEEDRIYISSPTAWPAQTLQAAAKAGDWDPDMLVLKPKVFTAEGESRLWLPTLLCAQAAACARILGRAVQFTLSKEEEFFYGPKRPEARFHIKSIVSPEGKILGLEAQGWFNCGAYPIGSRELLDRAIQTLTGLYSLEAARVTLTAGKSHTPPRGPWAGWGDAQALFALEIHAQEIALALHMDPLEWKLNNLLPHLKVDLKDMLHLAGQATDFSRKFASYSLASRQGRDPLSLGFQLRGVGLALGFQGNGPAAFPSPAPGVEIQLDSGNLVSVYCGFLTSHPALQDHFVRTVAQGLGVEPSDVRFCPVITSRTPDGGPLAFSAVLEWGEKALTAACEALQKKRFRSPLPIIVRKVLSRPKTWNFDGETQTGEAFSTRSWAACVTEVDVDPASSEAHLRKITVAAEAGEIIHSQSARQALTEGILAAVGWTCLENLHWEDHSLTNRQFLKYRIPAFQDRPEISVVLFPSLKTTGPRGVGTLGTIVTGPAVICALSQAINQSLRSLPYTRKDIGEALASYEN